MNRTNLSALLFIGAMTISGSNPKATFFSETANRPNHDELVAAAERIAERLAPAIPGAMQRDGVPGLAIAICDAHGALWQATYGSTTADGDRPVTASTNFSAQSTSKVFTAFAVLHAAESGLIDLDQPVAELLPGFTVKSRWSDHPTTAITVRMLLNHTAGLTQETRIDNNYAIDDGTFDDHVASIPETWLRFPPGSRQAYSNLGISVAGYAIQEASGLRFEEYLHRHVLLPLGMAGSTFDADAARDDDARAFGHRLGFEQVPPVPNVPPAGGLYTNLHDLVRFTRFLLGQGAVDGQRLVSPESFDNLYALPFSANGQTEGYCLGFELKSMGPIRYALAPGLGYGFLCGVMWIPDAGLGLVIMLNSQDSGLPMEILQVVAEESVSLVANSAGTPPLKGPATAASDPTDRIPGGDIASDLQGTYIGDGLFAACTGQILDLSSAEPTFDNIPMRPTEGGE